MWIGQRPEKWQENKNAKFQFFASLRWCSSNFTIRITLGKWYIWQDYLNLHEMVENSNADFLSFPNISFIQWAWNTVQFDVYITGGNIHYKTGNWLWNNTQNLDWSCTFLVDALQWSKLVKKYYCVHGTLYVLVRIIQKIGPHWWKTILWKNAK